MTIDPSKLKTFIDNEFENVVLPSFKKFLEIPCTSPAYDPDWRTSQNLTKAVNLLRQYFKDQNIKGSDAVVLNWKTSTPLLYCSIDGTSGDDKSILFYGHYDKMPAGEGWSGFKPYEPVVMDDYLYARGSADDGFAFYMSVALVKALKYFNIPHPRIVILVEGSEESGSEDLAIYLEKYAEEIGTPELVVTLDAVAGNYERLWLTNSIRGFVGFDVTVNTLTKGVHSGKYSGIAPESFMILRKLLSQFEDTDDKFVRIPDFEIDEIPDRIVKAAEITTKVLGDSILTGIPFLKGVQTLGDGDKKLTTDLYLNESWKPSLTVVGMKGISSLKEAGNVLRPFTTFHMVIRTPPTFDGVSLSKGLLEKHFSKNPPFNSTVVVENVEADNGILIDDLPDTLKTVLNESSKNYGLENFCEISMGGAIPFVTVIPKYFPEAKILTTGCAGPDSSCHGPNERLNIPYFKKITSTLTQLVTEYKKYI